MIQAKRLGYATFETADLDKQIDYYRQVVGLSLVSRDQKQAFLATGPGQITIVLEKGTQDRCTRLAFEVSRQLSAQEMEKRLSALGLKSEARTDAIPGASKTISFTDNKGTTIELFSEWSFVDGSGPAAGAVGALKLGHIAFVVPDPQAVTKFYEQTLGFRVSDWIGDYFAFLRCGPDHHTVNFIRGAGEARMHHMAFELRDAAHLHTACDVLGLKQLEIVWGPVRHGPGHNFAIYHRNPGDHMVEFFSDLDRMYDEELGYFEPRPWHGDRPQKPKVWDPSQPRDKWGLPPGPNWVRQTK